MKPYETYDLIGSPKLFDISIAERERKERFFRIARKVSRDWWFNETTNTGGIVLEPEKFPKNNFL